MQFNKIQDSMTTVPFQPYVSIKYCVNAANTKVPIPEPLTAIPVARDLRFSKYDEIITMAGTYMKPRPRPGRQHKDMIAFNGRFRGSI